MLFKMVNIKWEGNIDTITLENLYVSVNNRVADFDLPKTYEMYESRAIEHIARYLPAIEQYTGDQEWFENQLPLQSVPELIGEARGVLTHCIEQMQELLLALPKTNNWKHKAMVNMAKWQIQRAAETVQKMHFANYHRI